MRVCVQDIVLTSNPLEWSVDDVTRFIQTTDCAGLAWILRQHVRVFLSFVLLTRKVESNSSSIQLTKLSLIATLTAILLLLLGCRLSSMFSAC
jgi:hypothetical protein